MKRKLAGTLAAFLLLSCAAPGAFAANPSFKDLPASHWAYQEISRAVSYGIMNGQSDGMMNPDGTLTWAHYLAMLSRTFAPMAYEGARSAGTDWKTAGYQVAMNRGYLISGDFLTVAPATLNDAISRQDVAVLLSRTLPAASSYAGASASYEPESASDGEYVIDTGDNSEIRIVDSNGRLWIIKDGVSIPLSQSLYETVTGESVKEKAVKDGNANNTISGEFRRGQDTGETQNTAANFKVNPSYVVKVVSQDDGETTAPVRSGSVSGGSSRASDDSGETTAPRSSSSSGSSSSSASSSSSGASGWENTPVITPAPVTVSDPPLSDFAQMDANHQAAVRRLYDLGIVRGKSDGSFGPYDSVRRSDGAVLLMRTLDAIDELRSGESVSLTLELVDGDGKPVGDPVSGNGKINQRLSELAAVYAPAGYKVAPQDGKVSVITSRYALIFAPLTQAEKEEIEATEQFRQGLITQEEYSAKDFWLKKLGDNARKRQLIYGAEYTETIEVPITPEVTEGAEGAENPDAVTPADGATPVETVDPAAPQTRWETVTRTEIRYDSEEEARSHMASVEVPVWRLRGNSKVSGTISLTVNAALAEEVKAIFTEIYNDPEQFPISDGDGYSWRTNNSRSEHIQGTAIDLNVDSNFQVREGVALVGSGWTPGEDPYSITPGGSVVRIFAEHGWNWGGNAWAGHSDPSYGYHDYMHFSYFGR